MEIDLTVDTSEDEDLVLVGTTTNEDREAAARAAAVDLSAPVPAPPGALGGMVAAKKPAQLQTAKIAPKYAKSKAPPGSSTGDKQAKRLKQANAPAYVPDPGFVCVNAQYYSALNNETVSSVADKLGCDWRALATLRENTDRYGVLKAASTFRRGTLLRMPTVFSKWKVKKLYEDQVELEICAVCDKHEHPRDSEIILCDGCDTAMHLQCAGLSAAPDDDWFCGSCLEILRARKQAHGVGSGSLLAQLPPLPSLPEAARAGSHEYQVLLHQLLQQRRTQVQAAISEQHRAIRASTEQRLSELHATLATVRAQKDSADREARRLCTAALASVGLRGWGQNDIDAIQSDGTYEHLRENIEVQWSYRSVYNSMGYSYREPIRNESAKWKAAMALKRQALRDPAWTAAREVQAPIELEARRLTNELAEIAQAQKEREAEEAEERAAAHLEYCSLLGEERQLKESAAAHAAREGPPRLLGTVTLADESDVGACSMLIEPDELAIFVPLGDSTTSPADGSLAVALQPNERYAVFARALMFDSKRDEETPIESHGLRDAQRRLMTLLLGQNPAALISRPQLTPTVRLRAQEGDRLAEECFDLSELVRDCNTDLDIPMHPTPPRMAANGLELRSYQQQSLQWMIEKEQAGASGMGFAGSLWHRLRFLDDNDNCSRNVQEFFTYFWCELTGTLSRDIFNARAHTEQKDAALNVGGFPQGGVLGEEMGLGKTMICLALVVANPPPLANRVLARENIWSMTKHVVNHSEFVPPPSLHVQNMVLSNGTLVIAPPTLISQWQSEIERYAPWLSVLTLHSGENPRIETVSSADVVIVSTWLLQQSTVATAKGQKKRKMPNGGSQHRRTMNLVKRTHWHRIFVDESHYNQSGEVSKTKLVLATLSSTNRFCVTGTPVGHSLDDLQGQLRFLQIAPFNRLSWWQELIGNPYYSHKPEALRILRSLLSRVVVRHSKEQQVAGGQALIALPPRTVETVLIPFGSAAEQKVYATIEKRNRERFNALQYESAATVASHYLELVSMLYAARQACSWAGMIDLTKLDRANRALEFSHEARAAGVARGSSGTSKTPAGVQSGNCNRAAVLEGAMQRARPSAVSRMRAAVMRFQGNHEELMECPVCLEPVGEAEISLTPCGHPFCGECILSILGSASMSREASGDCPSCRERIKRSEITFLGDAAEATAEASGASASASGGDDASAATEPTSVNTSAKGFVVTSSVRQVEVSATGSTQRAGYTSVTTAQERRQQQRDDAALLPTLSPEFLAAFDQCESATGTKVARLIEEVQAMVAQDPTSKAVVFSQFLDSLDVAAQELSARGIRFVRVDGKVKQHERADALLDFASDSEIKIFLLSMRAGAVGLTLTAADHCFILDTPQNAAVEEQAIDRIHRIGQLRPVTVKRFVMKGTVEERIIGVRRSLGVDRDAASATVADSSLMGDDDDPIGGAQRRSAAQGQTVDPSMEGSVEGMMENERRQQRVANLAAIFGCSRERDVAAKRVAKA